MGETAEINIRPMTVEDIPAAYEIETQSFQSAWSLNYFKRCVENPRYEKFIVVSEEKILAFAILKKQKNDEILLMRFAVSPNFRQRGFGKIFLEFLIKLFPQWGGVLKLHVKTSNIVAIRLYESCNFKITNQLENFYPATNENAFIMERKI